MSSDDEIDFDSIDQGETVESLKEQLAALREVIYEKHGENAILSSRLNDISNKHSKDVNDLLSSQSQKVDLHRVELEKLKSQVAALTTEKLFLSNELKVSNIGKTRKQDNNRVLGYSGLPTKVPARNLGLGDGFIVKRPRFDNLTPATRSSSSNVSLGWRANDIGWHSSSKLLAQHHIPGASATSIQLLSELAHPTEPATTIAAYILMHQDLPPLRLMDLLIGLTQKSPQLESIPVLLSLLFSIAEHLPKTADTSSRERALGLSEFQQLILTWLSQLEPMPALDTLSPHIYLDKKQCLLLTSVLYALDVMVIIQWPLDLSAEFITRILGSDIPQVSLKGLNILRNYLDCPPSKSPLKIDDALLFTDVKSQPNVPSLEIIFSGILDSHPIHTTALKEYSGKLLALDMTPGQVIGYVQSQINSIYCSLKEAVIQVAASIKPTQTIWTKVIAILGAEAQSELIPERVSLISSCIHYLWQFSDDIRSSAANTNVLMACAARITYSQSDFDGTTIARAQDLLAQYINPTEEDAIVESLGVRFES